MRDKLAFLSLLIKHASRLFTSTSVPRCNFSTYLQPTSSLITNLNSSFLYVCSLRPHQSPVISCTFRSFARVTHRPRNRHLKINAPSSPATGMRQNKPVDPKIPAWVLRNSRLGAAQYSNDGMPD